MNSVLAFRVRKLKALEEKKLEEEQQANAALIDITGQSTGMTAVPSQSPTDAVPIVSGPLQPKSSVLVPPTELIKPETSTSDDGNKPPVAPSLLSAAQDSSECPDTEPMEVDSVPKEVKLPKSLLEHTPPSGCSSTAQSKGSTAKTDSAVEAAERISPSLAAASLVAVCSSPRLSVQTLPLSSTSGSLKLGSAVVTTTSPKLSVAIAVTSSSASCVSSTSGSAIGSASLVSTDAKPKIVSATSKGDSEAAETQKTTSEASVASKVTLNPDVVQDKCKTQPEVSAGAIEEGKASPGKTSATTAAGPLPGPQKGQAADTVSSKTPSQTSVPPSVPITNTLGKVPVHQTSTTVSAAVSSKQTETPVTSVAKTVDEEKKSQPAGDVVRQGSGGDSKDSSAVGKSSEKKVDDSTLEKPAEHCVVTGKGTD